ncbi:MAG TPA: efflux transporter outer membrane subunit [Steroidobacteraceae bacterium]|nr:efflux transporter outer membrane subunit [Steroidobacteraceae bacterium]
MRRAGIRGGPTPGAVLLGSCTAALLAAAVLSGCAVGPDYHTPRVATPEHFDAVRQASAQGGGPLQTAPSSIALARWWQSLGDPQLDALIDHAVTSNPDAIEALDRLQAARIYEAGLTGVVLPLADASGAYGTGTGSDLTRGRANAPLVSSDNTHSLTNVNAIGGFDAVWEIDVFGKFRREIEQARYATQATADARNAVLVSVIADVARAYVDLRGLQLRDTVLHSASDALTQGLNIATQRYQRGITNELDLTLAKRELASVQAQIPIIEAQMNAGEYTIATLLGEYPEDLVGTLSKPSMIPALPAGISTGMPLDLLRRRPDVQEAERDIARANARIGIATAELFPEFIATGAIGFQQGSLAGAALGQHIWSAGPGAIWPLLDFGQLDAQVQIANVATQAALENYKATIEQAVRQVDTAVAQLTAAEASLRSLSDALVAAQRAVTLANQRYNRGLTDYLNVVEAERAEYTIEEQYASTQASIDDQFIQLYRDLGGGWQQFQNIPAISRPVPAIVAIFKDTLARRDPLKSP